MASVEVRPSGGHSDEGTAQMTVIAIGVMTLVASLNSWFPPGIAVGLGFIVLGAVIAFSPGRNP
jgi:hypothetical protein